MHVIESAQQLRFVAGAGTRRELPFGATGMALLSLLEPEEQRTLLQEPFRSYTDKTITSLDTYMTRLEQTAADQVVIEYGEYYDGIMAIAVPIKGETPLTFTVVGPEERVRPNESLIIEELKRAAADFGRIGFDIPI